MSTIKTETLSTPSNATVPVDTVVNGTAKAWVNFNGTGTVAIRRAFNVSSITDNATGSYTVNFTTAMPDANYSVVATSSYAANGGRGSVWAEPYPSSVSNAVIITSGTTALYDCIFVNVSVFS
jgi:hypothetical protein